MALTDSLLNDFAIRSFRDVADHDYIAARLAYRANLFIQFHWSSLQALEKYLKTILLLNRIKAKDVGHDLELALNRAERLPFKIRLTAPSERFVRHLDTVARFRYLESSFHVFGPKMVNLDRAVWEVRRYCRVLDYRIPSSENGQRSALDLELRRIVDAESHPPQRFRVNGGVLEKIIDDPAHPAREPLLWKNLFFGKRVRRKVRMRVPAHATNAPLSLNPELLDEVLKYVHLPKDAVAAYRGLAEESRLRGKKGQPAYGRK